MNMTLIQSKERLLNSDLIREISRVFVVVGAKKKIRNCIEIVGVKHLTVFKWPRIYTIM